MLKRSGIVPTVAFRAGVNQAFDVVYQVFYVNAQLSARFLRCLPLAHFILPVCLPHQYRAAPGRRPKAFRLLLHGFIVLYQLRLCDYRAILKSKHQFSAAPSVNYFQLPHETH